MKKRIMSLLLAFVLICLMLPTTTFAAGSHTHCICGKTHKNVGDHDAEVSTTFTAVTDHNGLQNAATNGGSVYLANNITINAAITVTGNLTLCLNGYTLKNTASNTRVIHVNGGTLNLTDCGSTGTITGGSITGNGGGVYNQGTFAMYGGKISGNTANMGGGVYVLGDGFIMYGGEISNNTAKYNGGGVYNARLNTIIAGGSIKNNTANDSPSGGIYMNQSITLSGNPVISGNEYGSNDGSFDIYKNYTAIQVTEDFAPTGAPITVFVDPSYNDRVFLEAADSGVDIENYIGYFDCVSEFPLYKKEGKYYAGFAIVEEPTEENNYTVKVSSDKDLSCQWYKKELGNNVLTDRDMDLMDGNYDPISQSFTISDWGLTGYISLNAGDQLIVSSQSEIDAQLRGVDGKRDGNTYTFTAPRTNYYMLIVEGALGASVKLTKNGSIFVAVDGQTALTLDTSNIEEGEYQCKLVWDLGTDDPYDDIEAWSEIVSYTMPTYTITFDAQGGTTSLTTLPVIYGSNQNNKIDKATNPVRTDYTFLGWFTAPQGGEQVYQVSNGSCLACTYWSGAYDSVGRNATWKYAGNVTLYAQWSYSGTSTITFDAQGGTTTLKTLTVTYGSNTNNRLDTTTNPTKEGYTFDGWFDSPTGGTQVYKVSNGSCIKGDYWTKAWESAGTGATWKGPKELTLYAHWIPKKYTVTWKNYDGSVLETDTGVVHGTTPTYNGATPQKAEDENFTYTFNGWSPALEAVTGDVEYTAQFTAVSKRVDPTYTVTIPAAVTEGEGFKVSATEVVLNTDQTLTVTLQSDFKLRNEQNIELAFEINGGDIGNDAVVLSITGNGDKNNPLAKDSEALRIQVAEEAKYSGAYTGTLTFTIAVNSASNN